MDKNKQEEEMALLICKQLAGTITDEEKTAVDHWRRQNKHNEATYQRLTDYDWLTAEHRQEKLTDYRQPLAEAKRKLGIGRQRHYWLVAAAVALVVATGTLAWWNRYNRTDRIRCADRRNRTACDSDTKGHCDSENG